MRESSLEETRKYSVEPDEVKRRENLQSLFCLADETADLVKGIKFRDKDLEEYNDAKVEKALVYGLKEELTEAEN